MPKITLNTMQKGWNLTLKNNHSASLRALVCAVLALPLLGLSIPSAIGFWSSAGNVSAIDEAAILTAATGSAPVAAPVEGETYSGVYIELPLSATDADGDAVIFQLVDSPRLGTAKIEDNTLQYTPAEGKTGTDKFTYVAVDTLGNASAPAQVKIKIRKNSAKMTYADMSADAAHYAALRLSECGVMTGEKIGASYFLRPNDPVTRSEFIAMASAAARLPIAPTAQTDFADDDGLSAWAKPYISAAANTGLISGYLTASGNAEVRGQNPITAAEASVILNNLLTETLDTPVSAAMLDGTAAPAWAASATARLTAAEVLPDSAKDAPSDKITRKTACEMLYRAVTLMDA